KVKTLDTGNIFDSIADATIAPMSAWLALHGYNAGDRVTNGNNVYQCTTGGASAASGGPSGTSSIINDGTVVWEYLGAGTGAVDVAFEADSAGAVGALAGLLTVIVTPVGGWSNAVNLLDATVGELEETDPLLRAKRTAELAATGESTSDAIRAAVLAV